ncbi:MAG: alpha/beta hydrolase fold domain-containing protein [Verrucomicrobiales bacterium]|nr:alpha/beta hydrolase fold domain-containing protein [Verrucomicrobiales bacterium]
MKWNPIFVLLLLATPVMAQSRFDQWDKNGDGQLAKKELPVPLQKNFERVDQNQDGFISRAEDEAMRSKSGQGKGRGGASEGVKVIPDIDYAGTRNPRQALDLFLPKGHGKDSEALPLLVFIHGGGWAKGDKASGGRRINDYVSSGDYVGASIGYRLTDEAQWPAQIHDCKAAIRWLRANAAEYGIDPDRIAVWGTSAGGHLVAMLGVSGDVDELEGGVGAHVDVSSEVSCVVNFFGPSELLTMSDHPSRIDHDSPESPESKLVGGPLQENPDTAKNASPIHWVSSADEPSLIVHGTKDELVPYPQSVDFERALEEAGVPTILLTVEDGGHGAGFGPSVDEAVKAFLGRQLRGEEVELSDATVAAGE